MMSELNEWAKYIYIYILKWNYTYWNEIIHIEMKLYILKWNSSNQKKKNELT